MLVLVEGAEPHGGADGAEEAERDEDEDTPHHLQVHLPFQLGALVPEGSRRMSFNILDVSLDIE